MIKNKSNIIMYHGTASQFKIPDIRYARIQKDFGIGFYLTTDKNQATQFAKMQSYRLQCNKAYINQYCISNFEGLRVLEFTKADEQWLRFICQSRGKELIRHNYDVIIGKIADDNTRITLDQYTAGLFEGPSRLMGISPELFAIRMLKTDRLKNQICLCTQGAIDRMKFNSTIIVR